MKFGQLTCDNISTPDRALKKAVLELSTKAKRWNWEEERPMAEVTPIPTIWEVSDDLWERIEELLNEYDPPKKTGRKREEARKIINGIIYRFRTGCQWNQIPEKYGDDSTIHRTFQRWVEINLFEMLWSLLAAECDELALLDWEWQAADGWLGKARSGGDDVGPNPTDRAKNGTKKSLLTDAAGGPLSIVVAPANVNDHKLLEATIEAIVIERPEPTEEEPQNLCLDKAYDNKASREIVNRPNFARKRSETIANRQWMTR
jgi:putative transposase